MQLGCHPLGSARCPSVGMGGWMAGYFNTHGSPAGGGMVEGADDGTHSGTANIRHMRELLIPAT